MTYTRKNKGTCSLSTTVEIDEQGIVRKIDMLGGCSGNIQGVIKLAQDKPATEIISLLSGIRCGTKGTSCPDQLALALTEALAELQKSR